MFNFILYLLKLIFKNIKTSDTDYILKIAILTKENEILKRRLELQSKKVRFKPIERSIFAISSLLTSTPRKLFRIVTPETVLFWYKCMIKKRWTFKKKNRVGRPTVPSEIKQLILKIKNSNIMWGNRRISDELGNIDIEVSKESVRKIISNFRKRGMVKKSHTWGKFLKSNWNTLFAMDSFTIDSITGKHFHILVVLELKTRKIIQFAITEHPVREFVRQQIIEFTNEIPGVKHLIHDRAPEFCCFNFPDYGIIPKRTSVKSPNLNSYVERVIGTIQREALDWFIIFNRRQLFNILKEYTYYYNNYRPHQGINKIPEGLALKSKGSIKAEPILSGLHNNYFRVA